MPDESILKLDYRVGHAITELRKLPNGSVHCCICSPPYFGLRDYKTGSWMGGDPKCDHSRKTSEKVETCTTQGVPTNSNHEREGWKGGICGTCGAKCIDEQIGLEATPEAYVAKLVEVFREVKRVLRDDGTLWLNLGDSYNGSGGGHKAGGKNDAGFQGKTDPEKGIRGNNVSSLKPKDLCGVPWRVAFALQADGFYLRSEIIWAKGVSFCPTHSGSVMPESVHDRPTRSHEYVFLLTKSADYFYDAEASKEPMVQYEVNRKLREKKNGLDSTYELSRDGKTGIADQSQTGATRNAGPRADLAVHGKRNLRSVWTIGSKPSSGCHFATFPPALVRPMILAGTSEKGCCPKCGTPRERVVKHEPNLSKQANIGEDMSGGAAKTGNPQTSAGLHRNDGGVYSSATTIGWRPACTCCGIPLIDDPPKRPNIKKGETEQDHAKRLADYESALAAWQKQWNDLEPKYQACAIKPCVILDPFVGSGTTLMVARDLGRSAIGIDLQPEYKELAKKRLGIKRFSNDNEIIDFLDNEAIDFVDGIL